ncbi:hypothetical protein KKA03_04995 [archaeon]|nr:hypothetical protein [archaeon]
MSSAVSAEAVMRKALDILKSELNREEYLAYLEAITPRTGDAAKDLKDKTKTLDMKTIIKEARKFQVGA